MRFEFVIDFHVKVFILCINDREIFCGLKEYKKSY